MIELFICYLGLTFFLSYIISYIVIKGVPRSISETSYIIKDTIRTTAYFSLMCFIAAVCVFPLWIKLTPENFEFIPFVSCLTIIFVGTTPLYRKDIESKIHYTCGIIGFSLAILWLILMKQYIHLGVMMLIGTIWTYITPRKYTFIFEVIAYVGLCISLILKYLYL